MLRARVGARLEPPDGVAGIAIDLATLERRLPRVRIAVTIGAACKGRPLAPGLLGIVTGRALDARVLAHQGITSLRVIEALLLDRFPVAGLVAVEAGSPETAFVLVLVAREAVPVQPEEAPRRVLPLDHLHDLGPLQGRLVTGLAFLVRVPSRELPPRLGVLEALPRTSRSRSAPRCRGSPGPRSETTRSRHGSHGSAARRPCRPQLRDTPCNSPCPRGARGLSRARRARFARERWPSRRREERPERRGA